MLDRLWRKGDDKMNSHTGRTLVVKEHEVFHKIASTHNYLHHPGYKITFASVKEQFYGISRDECEYLIGLCTLCAINAANKTKAPLKPIKSICTMERVQVDLVDMSSSPDGNFKWILHLKDHFSKFSTLYPLIDKSSAGVATQIAHWIGMCGVPKILQCDNGTEFKGILLILLQRYGIKIINGSPRHPQTQGLVEQANGVMKKKLRVWMTLNQAIGMFNIMKLNISTNGNRLVTWTE